jgi:hypothetical protein
VNLMGCLSVVHEIRTDVWEVLLVARDLRVSFEVKVFPKLYW